LRPHFQKTGKFKTCRELLQNGDVPKSPLRQVRADAIGGQQIPLPSPNRLFSIAKEKSMSYAKTSTLVKNIVLVHGAWADGSSWSKLIPLLQAKGLHVVAAQNPLSSIADDVASTNRLINAQDGPVLLVGHSYGGAVITEAGNNPKVIGLVYVAAFAPDEGETLAGMAQKYPPTPAFQEIQPIEDGFLLLTPKGIMESFAQDLTPADKSLVLATQGATQSAILGTPIKKAAWHNKPSWFVIAANDRAISPEQEKATAERMGAKTITLPTSHLPMLSQPQKVADFVIEAVTSLSNAPVAATA
jgi:pimeloyl-ACP methyl ester carboxylesterase